MEHAVISLGTHFDTNTGAMLLIADGKIVGSVDKLRKMFDDVEFSHQKKQITMNVSDITPQAFDRIFGAEVDKRVFSALGRGVISGVVAK